jgi:hypothetical protein
MKNYQNRDKIVGVSRIVRVVLLAGVVLWGLGILVFLFSLIFTPIVVPMHKFYSSTTLFMGGMVIFAAIALFVNLCLLRFFNRLRDGCLFDRQTVGYLNAAGKWWIAGWLYAGLLTFLIRWHNHFQLQPTDLDLGGLFAGLILVFMAWLLKEGQELQEEQALTV